MGEGREDMPNNSPLPRIRHPRGDSVPSLSPSATPWPLGHRRIRLRTGRTPRPCTRLRVGSDYSRT